MRLSLLAVILLPLVTRAQAPLQPQSSQLRNGLVACWKLEELSGTRYDCVGTNHLTDNNNVAGVIGKVGYCGQFVASSNRFLSCASSPQVQGGDHSYTISCWFRETSFPSSANFTLVSKDQNGGGKREYTLEHNKNTGSLRFYVAKAVDSLVIVDSTFSPISAETWYHAVAWVDATAKTISVSVNNNTPQTTTYTGSLQAASTSPFEIGAQAYAAFEDYFDGEIDEVCLWNRALSSQERTTLYQSGIGLGGPYLIYSQAPFKCLPASGWYGSDVAANGNIVGFYKGAVHGWQNYGCLSSADKRFTSWCGADGVVYVGEKNINGPWSYYALGAWGAGGDADHDYASMAITSMGWIHAFYGCHDTPLFYKRSTTTDSVALWGSRETNSATASYPATVCDQSDKLYLFYRTLNRYLDMQTSFDNGTNWSGAIHLIDSLSADLWTYHGGIALGSEAQNAINICWTWRYNPSPQSTDIRQYTNIYYMRSVDGGTNWTKSDGTPYVLPVTPATAELVYTGAMVLPCSLVCDTNNAPHILFIQSNATNSYAQDSALKLASLSLGSWSVQTLPISSWYQLPNLMIDARNCFVAVGVSPVLNSFQVMGAYATNAVSWRTNQITSTLKPSRTLIGFPKSSHDVVGFTWADEEGNVRYSERQ